MSDLKDFLTLPDVTEVTEEFYVNDRIGKVVIKPMTSDEFNDYSKRSTNKVNKKGVDFDSGKFNLLIVAGQVVKPDFSDADLLKKANCTSATEFIKRKLFSGEIAAIANKVSEISGFDTDINDDIQEAKN